MQDFPRKHTIPEMGTSGVRQRQEIFNQPGFLEQFIQGIADHFLKADPELRKRTGDLILLGGDPRLGNPERIKKSCEILAGNGFQVRHVKDFGPATTPSMSHSIRHLGALAGIIFTASHNPFTDVGIKVNMEDGSPALSDTAKSIHTLQNHPDTKGYGWVSYDEGSARGSIGSFDPVTLYAELSDRIFDFNRMKSLIAEREGDRKRPFHLVLDGMGGAAGPFVQEVFVNRLGLKNIDLLRCDPDPYLGGPNDPSHPAHPEPDFPYIPDLIQKNVKGGPDLVAAYDSDGDRRLDGGSGFWIESADEFALFSRFTDLIGIDKLFQESGEIFFARSAVTAPAVDLLESELAERFSKKGMKSRILETATGFKWIAEFGNWGVEESNGLGNPWLREKDGIFATLFLFRIMLETGKTPGELMEEIWSLRGRYYFSRGEISAAPQQKPGTPEFEEELKKLSQEQNELDRLVKQFASRGAPVGQTFGGLTFEKGEIWDYVDPRGEVRAKGAATSLHFSGGTTVKMRFSGTGSGGYTLRIYIMRHEANFKLPKKSITDPVKQAIGELFGSSGFPGKPHSFNDESQPDPYI